MFEVRDFQRLSEWWTGYTYAMILRGAWRLVKAGEVLESPNSTTFTMMNVRRLHTGC